MHCFLNLNLKLILNFCISDTVLEKSSSIVRSFNMEINCAAACRYYEFEVLTTGFMKVGWVSAAHTPAGFIGHDEFSYAFDGFLVCDYISLYLYSLQNCFDF